MKFKDFTDIENLRHAKVEEKPIKNYTGNIDELSCPKPSTNTSSATKACLLYTSPSPRDATLSRMPSSA